MAYTRHKTFISYYHEDNEAYRGWFESLFSVCGAEPSNLQSHRRNGWARGRAARACRGRSAPPGYPMDVIGHHRRPTGPWWAQMRGVGDQISLGLGSRVVPPTFV